MAVVQTNCGLFLDSAAQKLIKQIFVESHPHLSDKQISEFDKLDASALYRKLRDELVDCFYFLDEMRRPLLPRQRELANEVDSLIFRLDQAVDPSYGMPLDDQAFSELASYFWFDFKYKLPTAFNIRYWVDDNLRVVENATLDLQNNTPRNRALLIEAIISSIGKFYSSPELEKPVALLRSIQASYLKQKTLTVPPRRRRGKYPLSARSRPGLLNG